MLAAKQQLHLHNVWSRNIFPFSMEGCGLYLPLWQEDMQGSTILSYDQYTHPCVVTAATWGITGRTFVANNNLVAITNHAAINVTTEDFGLGIWAKCTANSSDYRVMYWKANSVAPFQGYYLFLFITNGFLRGGIADASGEVNLDGATDFTSASVFSFFSMSVDRDSATGFKTYVNGILHATGNPTGTSATLTNTNTANIGVGRDGSSYDFGGTIGEVILIKGRAPSAAEWLNIQNVTKGRYI